MRLFWAFLFFPVIHLSTECYGSYDEILDLASQYNARKGSVGSLEKEKQSLLKNLFSLEKKTRILLKEKRKLEKEVLSQELQISKKSKEIIVKEQQAKNLLEKLQSSDVLLGSAKKMAWVDIISQARTPKELEEFQGLWEIISQNNVRLVNEYFENLNNLEEEIAELKELVQVNMFKSQDVKRKEAKLGLNHRDRKALLGRLESQLKKEKSNYAKAQKKGLGLAQKSGFSDLALLFSSSFYEKKSKLKYPVDGIIVQGFGLLPSPLRQNIKIHNNGVIFRTSKNSPVLSVADGKVKAIRNLGGIGKAIVIAHGDNYYSVYTHTKKVMVTEGEIVQTGVHLASTKQRELGFEIRHFSEPQNPEKWFLPPSLKKIVQIPPPTAPAKREKEI